MGGRVPFGERDRWEVRQLALVYFRGGRVTKDLEEFAGKWLVWLDLYLEAADLETGRMMTLPYPGGLLQQPVRTMAMFGYLRSLYLEARKKK